MNALKTLPAALVAALTVLIAQGADVLPTWLLLILAAAVAGVAVYATPPGPGLRTPQRTEPQRRRVTGEGGLVTWQAVALGVIVGGAILWLLSLAVKAV